MIEKRTLWITPFNEYRTLAVYVPNNYYEVEQDYPVLYMHDGQNVFQDTDAVGGVSLNINEYLDNQVIDIIVVAIDANPIREDRINEYCPWKCGDFCESLLGERSNLGGLGGEYIDYIVHELKPFIDLNYRTKKIIHQ